MKLKELKKTVNVSWSPADDYPVYLAAGTAAQQVDASFSNSASLDIYSLNLQDPGLDLELKSSLQTQHKFQKIVWSGAGVIVGGCDGGLLEFYSADKLLKGASDVLLGSNTKHSGHVSSLDINPYQKNLLASGASESEIFIWDLNNTSQPMAPGNKSQPFDHVQGLAWNQQVQHILGSTFATRCVVWDLRKNEPIMKLSDSMSRTRWRALAWHPAVATQLALASEDDLSPVVQIWDLRLASSPLLTLEGHHKGVLALSWCRQDSELLLSAGKDGRVLCWDPNNTNPGAALSLEVASQPQWVLDVCWCPRAPALLATSSFDQQLAVHSLIGGSKPHISTAAQSNIMDSFGDARSLGALPALQDAAPSAPLPQPPRAPQWLRRPAAARFAFGGKLVTFEKSPQEAGPQKLVHISQVVSDPEIVERANELETVLGSSLSQEPGATEQLAEYCRQKGDACSEQSERYSWFFLRANFLPTFRSEVLNLLGFKVDDIPSKFKSSALGEVSQPETAGLSRLHKPVVKDLRISERDAMGESTETEAELSTDTSTDLSDANTLIERKLANIELTPTVSDVVIPNGEDATSLISRALVCGNLEEAVELCLEGKRIADALVIASLGSQELLYKVQKYHLSHTAHEPVSLLASSLLLSRWDALVASTAARCWRDTLAALVTHCEGDALSHYCEMLGDRLAKESDPSLADAASICYLVAMSPDALLARWRSKRQDRAKLAQLAEQATLARRAAAARGRHVQSGGELESALNEYARSLAAQGCLQHALRVLDGVQDARLRERLMIALGIMQHQQPAHAHVQHAAPHQANVRNRTLSSHSQKRAHMLAHNDVPNTYNTGGGFEPSPWQPSAASFPASPFAAPPAPPQPPQPPRPSSVGPQSGGLTSRSKYKVDPSVQSAPLYNQYSFNNTPQQPFGGYNSPIPDQYNAASVPNTMNQMNPMGQMNPMNQMGPMNPMGQVNQLNPMNQQVNPMHQVNQLNPVNQMNPVNQLNPAVNGHYYAPQQPEPVQAPPKPAAPGWNDPPMPSKHKPKPEPVTAQPPITHPLFGAEPPQHIPLTGPMQNYNQQYPDQQQYQQQQYQQQQYQQQQFPPQQYAPAPQASYPQQAPSPAPEPVPKPPLTGAALRLQQVFDALRAECANRAPNPQTKRKLEDVQKRLETLYDMLREDRLSPTAVETLQAAAELAACGDHAGGAARAAALAAGADFAAVAAFLPALKVLLQLAQQMQLQLR